MNVNTTIDIDGAEAVRLPADLDPTAALELMRELEQRLRVASMRIAIEGEDINDDVLEALGRLTAFVEENLS